VREIQKRIGDKSKIEEYPWARLYNMALREPDIVLFTASRNADRENKFHWISHITNRRSVFFAKKISSLIINSIDSAKKVEKIGVMRAGNREKYLQEHGFNNLYSVTTEKQALGMLLLNRIDLIFMSMIEAATLAKNNGISFDEIEPKFVVYSNDSYIIMSKNNTPIETVKKWKNAAQSIKDDGTFEKIGRKWVNIIQKEYGMETKVENGVFYFWND